MDINEDWKKEFIEWNLRKLPVLGGKRIVWQKYPLSTSEHGHCEFCWDKFYIDEDNLKEGWHIEDSNVWICDNCYEMFKEYFEWIT